MTDLQESVAYQDKSTIAQEPPLTPRVVKGAGWVFAGKIAGRLLSLVKIVVLARLLVPEDFGLFGIVMLAIATLETFSQTGFGAALIQKKDNIHGYLDTAWTVQVIRGLVLAGILFGIAPAVGWFFEEPRVIPLLRVMCISVAIGGFANIGVIYFQKELEFHKQFVYNLVPSVLSLIVGVALAYELRSVWALVWAGLTMAAASVTLSYLLHRFRPHARLDGARSAELFRFGRWMLGSSVVVFLATQGDDAFLAKMLGAGALGLYQVAFRLSNAAATEITHVTSGVMFAAYAKVQDQQQRLGRGFLALLEVVLALTLPLTVFIVVAAREIVVGLLGPKWASAVLPLQVLAIAGFIRAIAATGGPVFTGTGRPHMDFWMNLRRASVIALTIYPLTKWFGVPGTSASVVLGITATLPVWTKVFSITGVSGHQLIQTCWPTAVLALLVPVGVYAGKLVPTANVQIMLISQLLAVLVLCGTSAWITARWLHKGPFAQAARLVAALGKPQTAT